MKKNLITLVISAFTALAAVVAVPANAATVKATVNGMVCAFCAQGIEKRLSKMPAAQAVFVDLKARVVAVEAKPGQTVDVQAVTEEIKDAGYDVLKIETIDQPLDSIRAEAKKRS